jgi:hypothetical protein
MNYKREFKAFDKHYGIPLLLGVGLLIVYSILSRAINNSDAFRWFVVSDSIAKSLIFFGFLTLLLYLILYLWAYKS